MSTISELQAHFDEHPSLDASLADFEAASILESSRLQRLSANQFGLHFPPRLVPTSNARMDGANLYPSHHSGFRSVEHSDSEEEEYGRRPESSGGYSPPAWRRTKQGRSSGFWNRNDNVLGREDTPDWLSGGEMEEDAILAKAARTRLPTGSLSPEKRRSPSPERQGSPLKKDEGRTKGTVPLPQIPESPSPNNYMRFSVRAEVQHRTEPFERAVSVLTSRFESVTRSWSSLFTAIAIALISIMTLKSSLTPGTPPPVPDLVKVAGLAKAFEPLIFYSEHGVSQIEDLQATGVAVWDLGESVRTANMTSAPIIVKELDELSENLKTLAIELTRFFANVDGDVDGILIVIDWAQRELAHLPSGPPGKMASLGMNTHALLSRLRILETASGQSTAFGSMVTTIFGPTPTQRTHATLTRTFHEFLQVLEEAINTELAHSTALFALFESIDRQFLNLARAVVRETDTQERLESELLSSLWTRVLGANSKDLRKYEQNRKLLLNVREKTVRNKMVLVDHNGKLLSLKANLEMLRMRLVSPLVRSENGRGSLSVEDQIRGLEGTGEHLKKVRERQKERLMERIYGYGRRERGRIVADDGASEGHEIEAYGR